MLIRDRIKELRRVKARELRPNPKNWRKHPIRQHDALRGLLADIGYAGALLARELDDGTLELIDGHLRAETIPDAEVPVLILDVTAEEADKLLATFDPLAEMAETDSERLSDLLQKVGSNNPTVKQLLSEMGQRQKPKTWDRPELEISPELFERQDYLVIYFDNQFDWQVACDLLDIKTVAAKPSGKSKIHQKGIGRVIAAEKLLALIQQPS